MTTTEKMHLEGQVQTVVARLVRAVQDRDLDGVMSVHAPDLVAYDVVPPLQYVGAEAYRKPWQDLFERFDGRIQYAIHDLKVEADDEVAFAYSLNHVAGTLKDGHKAELWLRSTLGFRRINGEWKIVHAHVSAPVDLATGKASLDLQP